MASNGNSISATIATTAARTAEEYWTPARMAAAKPVDLSKVIATQGLPSTTQQAAVTGPAVSVSPAAGTIPVSSAPALMHATSVTRPYTNLPDRLNGKVFFTFDDDGDGIESGFVCSGTVVNSTNKDMVDTAGHCVSDGAGRFHHNWTFVPAYSSSATGCVTVAGCRPYGTWTARTLVTRTEWHKFSNLKQDLGYAVLNTRAGKHIVSYLGGQGSTFNQSRTQTWKDYGYPQAAPFKGFDQKLCTSGRLANDNPSVRPGPLTLRIHCNMTGGSSGGGWIVRMAANGLGYVNSHNSYKYVGGPLANSDHMYGPYYGAEALSLFNTAKTL